MKSIINSSSSITMFVALSALLLTMMAHPVSAGGKPVPGGTIFDVGDCRSRFCPRHHSSDRGIGELFSGVGGDGFGAVGPKE